MKFIKFLCLSALPLLTSSLTQAQIPQLIHYQCRVVTGGTNFDGAGSFKFALVSSNGTTTVWSNNGSSAGGGEP